MSGNDYIYSVLKKFLNELSISGYVKDNELKKMILLDMIMDLSSKDFNGCLSLSDYQTLTTLFNRQFNSSCFFSFINTCTE